MTTEVEARFMNTLVMRTRDSSYVGLTTNLELNYKLRMLYFPIDFGKQTIDGLVDTGDLSRAIPEADLRNIQLLDPQSIVEESSTSRSWLQTGC